MKTFNTEEVDDKTFSVNVYTVDKDNNKIRTDRVTKIVKPNCHVSLLRLEDDDGSDDPSRDPRDGNSHFVFIKEYSRLMGSQTSQHKEKLFHCRFCQKGFQQESLLTAHTFKGCTANEVQAIEMPEENDKLSFPKHYKRLRCPYVISGDFECLTTLSDEGIKGTYQEHKPSGFMLNDVNSVTDEVKS